MSCRYGFTADRRIPVELVEADFEIGFGLIDLANTCPPEVSRILADADAVYDDILSRVARLDSPEGSYFQPLIGELRRAIDLALLRHSGTTERTA